MHDRDRKCRQSYYTVSLLVELKNNKQFIGKLKSFDIHINIVLEDVEERMNGEMVRKLNTVFIRGDTITVISTE